MEEDEENMHHRKESKIDDNGQLLIIKNSKNQIIPFQSSPLAYIHSLTKSKGIFIKLFRNTIIRITLKYDT
jgi:hypothetical protein